MTVNAPCSENAFGETIFAGPADVIHDLLATVFDNRFANARGDRVKCFVPGGPFPFSGTALSGALQWIKNAIRIRDLVESGWTFRAVAPSRARTLGVGSELQPLARHLV